MNAPARPLFVAVLVAALLALGLAVAPPATAAAGDITVSGPGSVAEPVTSRRVTFTITLDRSEGFTGDVDVDYATVAGTATANQDYVPTTGTVFFTGAETDKAVTVDILGDSVDEDSETFDLVLSNDNSDDDPTQIALGTATVTISDEEGDAPPRVSIGSDVVNEGDTGSTNARFTVALSSPSGRALSVRWSTADDTAVAGQDYTAGSAVLNFAPGELSKNVTVAVTGDVLDEIDEEQFKVNLSEATNVDLGAASSATGSILDNDDQPVVSIGDASGPEGGQANFAVTLSGPSGRSVTVSVTTGGVGDAAPDTDYKTTSAGIVFDPGETSKTFSVPLIPDNLNESDETFQAILTGASAAVIGRAAGTGTISDTTPGIELSVDDVSATESDIPKTMTFTVTLSGPSQSPVTVNVQGVDGTAKTPQDYAVAPATLTFLPLTTTQTVTVGVTGDNFGENNETFTLRLSNPTGAALAPAKGQATGTIIDDDGVPAKVSISNAAAVSEGTAGATAVFTLALERTVPEPVIVTYTTRDGTAKAGEDYQSRSGLVEFGPNQTAAEIRVPITNDALDEEDSETFAVDLSEPINAVVDPATATGTVTDDDSAPTVAIEADVELEEGTETPSAGEVVVRLSAMSGRTVSVAFTSADGTATALDYAADPPGTLTFAPGVDRQTIGVDAIDDRLDEDPETFTVSIGPAVTNATLGTRTAATVTIEDGDVEPTISVIGPDPVIERDTGEEIGAVFTLALSDPSGRAVMVNFATSNGTAQAGSDYTTLSNQQSIVPGDQSKPVTVVVRGDTADEANEDFTVTISNPVNATLGEADQASALILDNDGAPQLVVTGSGVSEGNSGTTAANATVQLVPSAVAEVSVRLRTGALDDTATAPADYTGVDRVLTFTPGQAVKVETVPVVGDLVDESTETLTLTLSEATGGATVATDTGPAVITITDDDGPTLSVNDASAIEGTGGTVKVRFNVALSAASPQPVSVNYTTSAGTATAADDFVSQQARTLNFAAGERTKTVDVDVVGDALDEGDETFTLGLSNPVNATIGRSVGTATIIDDDQPVLAVSAAVGSADSPSVAESDFGVGSLVFTLNLQMPPGFEHLRESSVAYTTASTEAVAGGDFLPISGRVSFAVGETTKTITVSVTGDSLFEADETVSLALSDPVNLTLPDGAMGTIINDDKPGYALVATDGGLFAYGDAGFFGSTGSIKLNQPMVGMAAHPSGRGYWMVAADGGIFAFGEAEFFGSTGGKPLNRPIVGMAATPSGEGYWLVASDGGIFAFGDAGFHGSTGAITLNRPVRGMAATPSGEGYWLVATDGGIFAFGDASFKGSTGSLTLNQPIVGMASTPGGGGYWLVASDGGIFAFGDAAFKGSTGGTRLNRPVVGMAASPSGQGYWLVADDGGIFAFGDAEFLGSTGNIKLNKPVVGMAVL